MTAMMNTNAMQPGWHGDAEAADASSTQLMRFGSGNAGTSESSFAQGAQARLMHIQHVAISAYTACHLVMLFCITDMHEILLVMAALRVQMMPCRSERLVLPFTSASQAFGHASISSR